MKKRFTEEQIIGFLREAEAGMPVKELCRKHGFSEASYYLWMSSRSKRSGRLKPASKGERRSGRTSCNGGYCSLFTIPDDASVIFIGSVMIHPM